MTTGDLLVERTPMTKEEAENFFGILFHGKHHIPSKIKPFGSRAWKISAYGGNLTTFDFDGLTRLVFLAHDKCVRVELVQGAPGRVGIVISKRHGRSGQIWERHPSLKCAVINWRMKHVDPDYGSACASDGEINAGK